MPTSLSATYQAGTPTDPPRVLLQVTGAPSLAPNYASNFATTVDGWTGTAGTFLLFNQGPHVALDVQGDNGVTSTFSRTVTGLTIGQGYAYTLMATPTFGGTLALGVAGMTAGAFTTPVGRAALSYAFTATATSHVIQVQTRGPNIGLGGTFDLDTVKVIRTTGWGGTTITRTDANGTAVVREAPGGQDTVGTSGSATMTVTDYEAALGGAVSYVVTDGNGGMVSASPTTPAAPGVWLTLPALAQPATPTPPPFATVLMVTGWDETARSNGSLHTIIGRPDPIANPGPLLLRSGALTLLCADYTAATAVRDLLAAGDVALLRQPTFTAADMYLVATEVSITPTTATAPTQLWTATVRYQEVPTP